MKLDSSKLQDYIIANASKKAIGVKEAIDITRNYIDLRNSVELFFIVFLPLIMSVELIFFLVSFLIKNH